MFLIINPANELSIPDNVASIAWKSSFFKINIKWLDRFLEFVFNYILFNFPGNETDSDKLEQEGSWIDRALEMVPEFVYALLALFRFVKKQIKTPRENFSLPIIFWWLSGKLSLG